MTLVVLLVALAVVGVTAAVVAGGLGAGMPAPVGGPPPAALPPGRLRAADVDPLRFRLVLRGYRMDEVDAVLARLREELALREAEVDELRPARPSAGLGGPWQVGRPAPPADATTAAAATSDGPPVGTVHALDTDDRPVADRPGTAGLQED